MPAVTALVPLADYLGHTYEPDCDYIEGILEERNTGEISNSDDRAVPAFHLAVGSRSSDADVRQACLPATKVW